MNQSATLIAVPAVPAELEKAANETGLVADGVQSLKAAFAPHFVKFHEVASRAKDVANDSPRTARAVRLELKSIRIAADKTRIELKADSLRRGKAIDGINNLLEYQLVPIEEELEKIERAAEIAEAKRKADLQAARMEELRPYVDQALSASLDLGGMSEVLWLPFLAGTKASHEAKIEHAARMDAERIAAEQAAAEAIAKAELEVLAERERMRAENARLAVVAAAERAAREAAEKIAAQERAEASAREKAAADEAARIYREAEAKAAQERAEAARLAEKSRMEIDAAQAIIRENEQKAQAIKDAEKAAAKKAASAPDRDKLTALAATVRAIGIPSLKCEGGVALTARINEQVAKFATWIESEAAKL